jgi:hypothetical protein
MIEERYIILTTSLEVEWREENSSNGGHRRNEEKTG